MFELDLPKIHAKKQNKTQENTLIIRILRTSKRAFRAFK